jgi:Putative beta-barrel porin 2
MPHVRYRARALAPHLLLAACLTAHLPLSAQPAPSTDRPWNVALTQDITHNTNATNSPRNAEVSDTVWTTTLSGGLRVPFGRQRAYANGALSYARYSNLDGLDGQGYNLGAGIDWETVNNLSGSFSANAGRRQADFNTGINTLSLKNTETFEELRARVLWGGVSLFGIEGTAALRQIGFSAPEFAAREYVQNSASGGVIYRPSSALTLGSGLSVQYSDYDVPAFGQTRPDTSKRRDLYVSADWNATGASVVGTRLNFGKTDYERPTAEDFTGVTGSAYWQWRPTGRTSLTTALTRDTGQESGFQRLTNGDRTRLTATDFSRVTTLFSVNANYALTGKVTLTGNLGHAQRSLVDSLTNGKGKDNTTTAKLGANWAATRIISVGCNIGHELRSASGFGTFDYTNNTFGCLGRVALD